MTGVLFCQPDAAVLELMQARRCNVAPASLGRRSGATACLDLPDSRRARATANWAWTPRR